MFDIGYTLAVWFYYYSFWSKFTYYYASAGGTGSPIVKVTVVGVISKAI
tara:strand:+ start:475 stop:621 length:147 start_codon:yes stop_codon:yes gene_type:complete